MYNIIDELDKIDKETDKYMFLESKACNVIISAINILKEMQETLPLEESEELRRRMLNSIKGNDVKKFQRKIRELREHKHDQKKW